MKTKYLILGAGPAGLTFANVLKERGETSFLVLEKEAEAGGLCRSVEVDGSPFDIGGGHFLDVKRPKVNEFLFRFMPEEEWDRYTRDSRIEVNGELISHPIEANIWQMSLNLQVEYLKAIARAGCSQGTPKPESFVDWIYWKLGDRIAEDYMLPYNRKMFGEDLNALGTYWLEKLPNVSFEETLKSCLARKAYGTQPGHAEFYYPRRYGYGELWRRMAETVAPNIIYNTAVSGIDFEACAVVTEQQEKYEAEHIVTTIPWAELTENTSMPRELEEKVAELKYSSVETRYYGENLDTAAHWIYYPDNRKAYHRILVRHNFCPGSRGYWTETNCTRIGVLPESEKGNYHYMNKYAYPLNTLDKPGIMRELLVWAKEHHVFGLGRWGEHQHYNSDVTVERAMGLVNEMLS